ncbi:MAG: ATP-binding protein [Coleofasciculus sp. G3-WIS-01]|uniref:ATP-binding protein n=1 Tax=Coleofasciculus sp. G3-WIS-01 TaxID=3069528 RepID=UPI0032FBF48D
MTLTTEFPTSDLIEIDKTLESLRDSGFDLATASGEVVDNSYEADATVVRIRTIEKTTSIPGKKRSKAKRSKVVESIAFADNGHGIPYKILPSTLKLGFSTRYNQRNGLGRFGVGMKLAAISQARRIDIYTKPLGSKEYYHAYLDLDEVSQGIQTLIKIEVVEGYPPEYSNLMQYPQGSKHPKEGKPFESGTLVVWSKVDRLIDGGNYGSAIQERMQELTKFLARAYRHFIDEGFYIELNGKYITLHDPLFLLKNPRVIDNFGKNLHSKLVDEGDIEIDDKKVHIKVTLYPEEFRRIQGQGGKDIHPVTKEEDSRLRGLYIPDNKGRISIVRNGREIYYDIVPKLLPYGVNDIDRFIGIEISFPATLDEYLQVRHVKRGAEPVSKLREELKEFLIRPIKAARKEIRSFWQDAETAKRNRSKKHEQAENAVQRAEKTLPVGRGGMSLDAQAQEKAMTDLLLDLEIDPEKNPESAEEVRQRVQNLPITIVDSSWPGKELFDITHLNGKAIIRINHRHPFIQEVYDSLKDLASRDSSTINVEEAIELARKAEIGLDILFMAYAKAENMNSDPDGVYGDLRTYWGQHTYAYSREALSDK